MDEPTKVALERARLRAGGAGARVYLAKLGKDLRQAGAAWAGRLSDLLRAQPDFCSVEGTEVEFLAGDIDASRGAATDRVVSLQPELFIAFIRDRSDRATYLDLDSLQVHTVDLRDGEPGPPVSEDPLNYLRVPAISTAEQLEFAEQFLADDLTPAQLACLGEAGGGWAKQAERLLPAPRWTALKAARQRLVVERAARWLQDHDIGAGRFLRTSRRKASPGRVGSSRPPTDTTPLRALVHEAIDQLTEEELRQLPLPAHLLTWAQGSERQ